MGNLNFNYDDGVKTYTINNDENRVVRVNMSDIDFIRRMYKLLPEMERELNAIAPSKPDDDGQYTIEETFRIVDEFTAIVNKYTDKIFGYECHDVIFGKYCCPASVAINGEFIAVNFLTALAEFISKDIEKANKAQANKIKQYRSLKKKK